MSGFSSHIKEAIALNQQRKPYYSSQTNGGSSHLSNALILMERLLIPIAYYFDWKATTFNEKGIPIIKNDFVPMEVRSKEALPKYTSIISQKVVKTEQLKVNYFLDRLGKSNDLIQITDITLEFYESVKSFEQDHNVHFAMLLHLLESVMLIARNGVEYATQSKGSTKRLTLQLINIHKIAIKNALKIDYRANQFHQQKVGIIINDLPKIEIP